MIKSFLNRNHFINYYKCGNKIKKKQEGGDVEEVDKNEKVNTNEEVSETLYDVPQMNYPPSNQFQIKKRRNNLIMNQNGGFIPFDKCGKKINKKQEGGNVESSKPTKTHKVPFVVIDNNRKKKTTYVKDEATRDSLYANRYYDDEVLAVKPGNWIKGKWTPDRTKAPYNKKK